VNRIDGTLASPVCPIPPIRSQNPLGDDEMEFIDRVLICVDCGKAFVFTAGEQYFFQGKNFQHDPKHCKTCKAMRAGQSRVGTETTVICAQCKAPTTVPFRPRYGWPVFCRSCFQRRRQATAMHYPHETSVEVVRHAA
jgi:CxxC-x17-CxxC domain-containing protein